MPGEVVVTLSRQHAEWLAGMLEAEVAGTDAFVPVIAYDEEGERKEVAAMAKALREALG